MFVLDHLRRDAPSILFEYPSRNPMDDLVEHVGWLVKRQGQVLDLIELDFLVEIFISTNMTDGFFNFILLLEGREENIPHQ